MQLAGIQFETIMFSCGFGHPLSLMKAFVSLSMLLTQMISTQTSEKQRFCCDKNSKIYFISIFQSRIAPEMNILTSRPNASNRNLDGGYNINMYKQYSIGLYLV